MSLSDGVRSKNLTMSSKAEEFVKKLCPKTKDPTNICNTKRTDDETTELTSDQVDDRILNASVMTHVRLIFTDSVVQIKCVRAGTVHSRCAEKLLRIIHVEVSK